jgi:eukaryotic-like serine/threonine-protein kinase
VEPLRSDAPDFKPHLFGKFYLLQRLASGGMAEIYRAKVVGAAGFEKELALKRILAARAQDAGFVKMLVNEAKLTAQLTHSNIAQIYECGAVDGTWFIAMELVYGVSLKEVVGAFARAGATLSPEQAIFVVLQLLQGLDYAHRKTDAEGRPLRIVHCDVSPDNALVTWEGEIKLLDFGIARAATGLSNYKQGMLMGKLGYVAPEQASLEKAWDHRVDLFAAGIILYELLTRQKPFPRATDVESLVASRKAKVAPPSALDDRIPRELDEIIEQALAYQPERRFASARAFADALVDVLFPTPHSAIQDVLSQQMKTVFADAIAKQRAARAHDALVVKVLRHLEEEQATRAAAPAAPAAPIEAAPALTSLADPTLLQSIPAAPKAASRPASTPARRAPVRGVRPGRAAAAALALAAASAAGTWAAARWFRPGVLLVTAEPADAQVSVDGRPVASRTPALLEGFPPHRPVSVVVSALDRRPVTLPVAAQPGALVRRVHAELTSALGRLTVETDPPGAEVRIDDRPAGVTPLTLPAVRLDERHRIDLLLPGHELDQLVVLPDVDGQRVFRRLVPAAAAPAAPARPARHGP